MTGLPSPPGVLGVGEGCALVGVLVLVGDGGGGDLSYGGNWSVWSQVSPVCLAVRCDLSVKLCGVATDLWSESQPGMNCRKNMDGSSVASGALGGLGAISTCGRDCTMGTMW
eukprot:CAMPEP_0119288972 /NCGR_PEP_ID=MMETSP1329-20130426/38173_1 /TAXON_ID=114041 /ORGANISM="Genus nov. species nov., Strain RCC1024" /LENGTH=111 /DNA_ID=CAMNT_0007289755 /DNA_START=699 /DNA_END=1031 /DNA_ORIENTATION=+